jgi:hypothetical protein
MTNNLDNITIGLDLAIIKSKVPTFSSEKLCEIIVCDRYFGCFKEVAIICMEELAKRRISGDNFEFETHIENSLKEMPELNFSMPNLGDVLRASIGRKINK